LTSAALITSGILAATIVLFVSDRLRVDVVAVVALLALILTGVAPLELALSGFSNPAVLMIAGLFVVGSALTETGVANWLAHYVNRAAGASTTRAVVVVTTATALVSAFMSSTGTVAILLPVVGTVCATRGIAPSTLLMPLAFGAHLGSNLTLISTPPNLVVSDALRAAGHEPFRFFSFLVPGIAALVVGVVYLAVFGPRLLSRAAGAVAVGRGASLDDLAAEYGLLDAAVRARVPRGSRLVGMALGEANLRAAFGVTLVALARSGEAVRVVPRATFESGDELLLVGGTDDVEACAAAFGLEPTARSTRFALPPDETVVEVVLPRRSRLQGHTLRDAKFRDRFRATVLGLRRLEGDTAVCHTGASLRDVKLRPGDTLLLKGRRRYMRNLRDERAELVLVAEPDPNIGEVVDLPRALGAGAVTLAMLVVMALGWLPNVVAVLGAAALLVLTGCIRPADVYRSVSWESVVLIAGMIPLAASLERTGCTAALVNAMVRLAPNASPVVVLSLLTALTSAGGLVLSNTAIAVLVAPIAVSLATAFHIAPQPLLMGVAFGASAAFATPIASPVNVLVMTPGNYRFVDYTRVGLPLQLLVLATSVLVIPLVWPFQ